MTVCGPRSRDPHSLTLSLLQTTTAPPATTVPSPAPTRAPTRAPTHAPSRAPTLAPTKAPTRAPSYAPTFAPTKAPTHVPSHAPTHVPSRAPTQAPAPERQGEAVNPPLQGIGAGVGAVGALLVLCGFFFGYRYCPETKRGFHGGEYTEKHKLFSARIITKHRRAIEMAK